MLLLLAGFGAALAFTPPFIAVVQYFDAKRGVAMALGNLGAGIGALFLSSLIGFSLKEYGYPGCMLLLGAVCFHCCISGALLRPFGESSPFRAQRTLTSREDIDTIGSGPSSVTEEEDNAANYAALLNMFSVAAFVHPNEPNTETRTVANSVSSLHQEILDKVSKSVVIPLENNEEPAVVQSLQDTRETAQVDASSLPPTTSIDFGVIKYRNRSQSKPDPLALAEVDSIVSADIDDLVNERPAIDRTQLKRQSHATFVSRVSRVSHVEHVSIFHQAPLQESDESNSQQNVDSGEPYTPFRRVPHKRRSTMTFASMVTRKTTAVKDSLKRALLMCKHPTLAIYCVTLFVLPLCFNYAVLFLPDTAVTNGITVENAALLVAIFGIFDSIGMIFWGFLYDISFFRPRRRLLFASVGKHSFLCNHFFNLL